MMKARAKIQQAEFKEMPIYTATKSLDVKYKFAMDDDQSVVTTVPAANVHAILRAGYDGLMSTRRSLVYSNGEPVYTQSIDEINFAPAAITALWTDTSLEEGNLGDDINQSTFYLAVKDKNDSILSTLDFYTEKRLQKNVTRNKAARDTTFNTSLNQRIAAFADISASYNLPMGAIATTNKLDDAIKDPMFHETFHHSEQAAFHYLSSAVGLSYLINNIVKERAVHLYGLVLDIFTQRMICTNCNCSALGMQCTHESGFLHDLSQALARRRVEPRDKLMLNVRVSAKQAPKNMSLDPLRLPNDKDAVHEYNPDRLPQVFQAVSHTLGTKKIIRDKKLNLSSYPGSFFVSSGFSKARLEKEIKAVRRPK